MENKPKEKDNERTEEKGNNMRIHIGKKQNKCKRCNYLASQVCRSPEKSYEDPQWRKAKQM